MPTTQKRGSKCDLQRPTCGQCRAAGIECAGYIRQRLFVNATVTRTGVGGPHAQSILSISTSTSTATSTSTSISTGTPTITLPPTLARTAYQDKYISLFWTAYTPGSQHISPPTLRNSLGSWTNAIQDLYLTDDVLRKALLAISLTTIGRGRDGQKWMAEQGLEMYTGALKDMSATLAVGGRGRVWGKGRADALLTASKLFSLYEAMHGADERHRNAQANSWHAHCGGEMALLTARSPLQYASGHAHRLFVDGRLHLTVSAILARKRTLLSSPEWKTIPWLHHPKSLRDKLLDILVDIPTLYEEIDILNALSSPPTDVHRNSETQTQFNSLHHSLLTSCWALDNLLDKWYQCIPLPREEGIPTPNTSHPTVARDNNATDTKKEEDSEFIITLDQLALAHVFALYWATRILLCEVFTDLLPHGGLDTDDQDVRARIDPRQYIRRMVGVIPIFLHPAVGVFRVHLSTFAMGVVARWFGRGEKANGAGGLGMDGDGGDMRYERELFMSYLQREEARGIARFLRGLIETDAVPLGVQGKYIESGSDG
ncbi:hypothetical protein FQN51_006232 [Onygenales sp. PD_10]|nr:hypothetical protein FQN51_006232 [Onygenales sp. PD_10]